MEKLLDNYKGMASPETLEAIQRLAQRFQGSSILHIYSGRLPTGIRGMLAHLSELCEDVGIRHWSTALIGTEEYFDLVRLTEHGLADGTTREVPEALLGVYLATMQERSRRAYLSANLVIVHGLQPLGLVEHRLDHRPWIWQCHSDLSSAAPGFWPFAQRFASRYQAALFSHGGFVPPLDIPTFIVPPSVDPFAEVNRPMTRREIEGSLKILGVPSDRPIVLQFLSRGSAGEALEVIRTWKDVPASRGAVLVLVQIGAPLTDQRPPSPMALGGNGAGGGVCLVQLEAMPERELCALGWASTAALDSSDSGGPNLHLLDLIWKAKPVLVTAGSPNACFIPEGAGGHCTSAAQLARRLGELLGDEELARRMGHAGRSVVLDRYLAPRHVLDYLKLLLYFECIESTEPQ